jgi:hypothetical protein
MVVCCYSIIEYSHVMYRPRPTSKNKYKSHVKVTDSHDILCSHALAAQVLHKLIIGHHTRYMSSIYSPYAVLELGIEPTFSKSRMHCSELWVDMLNDVSSKLHHTLQNFVKHVGDSPQ